MRTLATETVTILQHHISMQCFTMNYTCNHSFMQRPQTRHLDRKKSMWTGRNMGGRVGDWKKI